MSSAAISVLLSHTCGREAVGTRTFRSGQAHGLQRAAGGITPSAVSFPRPADHSSAAMASYLADHAETLTVANVDYHWVGRSNSRLGGKMIALRRLLVTLGAGAL